jgi:hypothetical protein
MLPFSESDSKPNMQATNSKNGRLTSLFAAFLLGLVRDSESGGSKLTRNADNLVPFYTASHIRGHYSISYPRENFCPHMIMNVQTSSTVPIFDQLCNYQLCNVPWS